LAAFKAPASLVAEIEAQEEQDKFEVYEENWETVTMFLRLDTQWQWAQRTRTGLNYNSVSILLTLFEVENKAEVFDGLQLMERAALNAWSKESDGSR
jgi:hypothetical protein